MTTRLLSPRRASMIANSVIATVVAAAVAMLPGVAEAAGTYDPTFSGGGRVAFGGGGNRALAMEVGNGDQIATVSLRENVSENALELRMFNADGTPNVGFSGDGAVQFGASQDWAIPAMAWDKSTGNLYVSAFSPSANVSRVWRFTAAGTWDTTWGTNASASIAFPTARLTDIALDSAARVLVADRSSVYRLSATGPVDPGFGAAGGTTTPLSSIDHLSLQGDGRILAAGRGSRTLDVVRLTRAGTIDTAFGQQGRASIDVAPPLGAWNLNGMQSASAVQTNDGSIVLAGGVAEKNGNSTRDALIVTRFTSGGMLDSAYATHRDYQYSVSGPLTRQGNDKVLVPVTWQNRAGVVRLAPTGAFDTAWGAGGVFLETNTPTRATGVGVQAPGRVVVSGHHGGTSAVLWGIAGDATPTCHGAHATAFGGAGSQLFIGTTGPDVIVAGGGSDTIRSGNGDDRICAGGGKDKVKAGNGADRVWGGGKADVIKGGAGRDKLRGNGGADVIKGGPGRDKIKGGAGNDRLVGGPGKDKIKGGTGKDRIRK